MTRHLIALVTLLALLPSSAAADVLRVPQDHDTVQDALAVAAAGDTIRVAKGTYPGFTVDGMSGVTIKGKGKPVFDGGGAVDPVITVEDSTDVVLDGLVVQGTTGHAVRVKGSTDVTVRRCTVTSAKDGVRAWDSSGVVVERCRLMDLENGVDFSDEDGTGPANDSVVCNNRFDGLEDAVDVDGDGHLVERNRFREVSDTAISLDDGATNVTIQKNRIFAPNTAVRLLGSGHMVLKNVVKTTTNEGITVEAAGCVIEKNKLTDVDDDAIDLEGDDNLVSRNKIKATGDNGIEMDPASGDPYAVTGNVVERNRIKASGGDGIYIGSSVAGNTLERNRAAKSGGFDLFSDAPEGANTFIENKFKTTEFD